MLFSCLSNFLFLFQECSVVNTLGSIACLGLFPAGGMVSTTRRRFGKTMVEVVHPGELRTTLASGQVGRTVTTVCGQDDDILCIQLSL